MYSSDLYSAYNAVNSLSGGSSYASAAQGVQVWTIIALILSIVGGILVYFLYVNSKKEIKNKFWKWLKDFLAFKIMWIEAIMKILYYFLTIFVMLFSFTWLAMGGTGVLMWLGWLVLGPIIVRVLYELSMMFIMIWRNTRDIAKNTEKK